MNKSITEVVHGTAKDLYATGLTTDEQQAARERVRERMRRGYHLGGKRLQREEIYDLRTDYD